MNITNKIITQEKYIRENNYSKKYGINLYCFQFNLYKNTTHYLQQFICYLYKK